MAIDKASPVATESLPRRPRLSVLALCFFLSGATGLVYQVVWQRMLGLVFGHGVHATTAVLVAFMIGLGLGSVLVARRASRFRNLIVAYGWLEVGIGLYCVALPWLLPVVTGAYVSLHRAFGLSYQAYALVQLVFVVVALLVPTTLMGGTLPVLGQALARPRGGLGRTIGLLYAVNTFGAVAGVAVAGYVLLPALGNRLTITLAALANLAVGALAIAYGRARGTDPAPAAPLTAPPPLGREARLTLIALAVSGAIAMVYEVAWTRALGFMVGSSTYAFTATLVAFLAGIAGGSMVYAWLWGRRRASTRTFAVLQACIGLATVGTMLLYDRLPELFLRGIAWSDLPAGVQLTQVLVCSAALLGITAFIGATFPCAVSVVARDAPRAGEDVGRAYAVGTLGAIAGCLAGGLVLIPGLGLQTSLRAAVIANFLLAATLLVAGGLGGRWRVAGLAAVMLAAVGAWFVPPWSRDLLASGVAVYAKDYMQVGWAGYMARPDDQKFAIAFYRDGPTATVTVHRYGDELQMRLNGKTEVATDDAMSTQLMLGHLPLLLHPGARHVMVLGLGGGVTAGAIASHPVERVDVVELEPAVVEAARLFAGANAGALDDARVRITVADGRNFLLTTPHDYDVIVSEPSNPWISGRAALFTAEMFHHARSRLRPGGIMVQWIQGYSLDAEDLKTVVRTFATVFPTFTVWNSGRGGFLLVGSVGPATVDVRGIQARIDASAAVSQSLAQMQVAGWADVLGLFMLDAADATRMAGQAALNTDDRLPLEFSAPRALYRATSESNWRLLAGAQRSPLPPLAPDSQDLIATPAARTLLGFALARRNQLRGALAQLEQALALAPSHPPALEGATALTLRLGRNARALELAQRAVAVDPQSARVNYLAGVAAARVQDHPRAATHFERAVALAPADQGIRQALLDFQVWGQRGGVWSANDDYVMSVFAR